VNRQVADELQAGVGVFHDPFRFESHGGKLSHIEEVGAFQVRVAVGLARRNAAHVHSRFHRRRFRVLRVEVDAPGDLAELAFDVGDHHVLHAELCARMCRVNVPNLGAHFRSFKSRCHGSCLLHDPSPFTSTLMCVNDNRCNEYLSNVGLATA
jgi:hypothetical protein